MAPRLIDEEVEALRGLVDTQHLAQFCSLPVAREASGIQQAPDSRPLAGWLDRWRGCRDVQRPKWHDTRPTARSHYITGSVTLIQNTTVSHRRGQKHGNAAKAPGAKMRPLERDRFSPRTSFKPCHGVGLGEVGQGNLKKQQQKKQIWNKLLYLIFP